MNYMHLFARLSLVLLSIMLVSACSRQTSEPEPEPEQPAAIPPDSPGFNTHEEILSQQEQGVKAAQELLKKAEKLADEGKNDEALAALEQAVQEDPMNAGAHSLLGQELARRGYDMEAEKTLRFAIRLDPALTQAIVALADLQLASDRRDEAAAMYRLALANDPQNTTAKAGLEKAAKKP